MAGRPCNPDSDLKRLWRALLPGTPFPQCGVTASAVEPEGQSANPENAAPAMVAPKVTRNRQA